MGQPISRPADYPATIESNPSKQVIVSVPDRKTRSLFKWISRVTGVDACWIEGIDADDNPLWGIARKLTKKLWYIFSRRLRPALAVTALGGALLLPVHALHAQTGIELSTLDGANGFVSAGDGGASGFALSAGDFNDDGVEDLVVGAPNASTGAGTNVGKTYIVFGKTSDFNTSLDLSNLSGTDGYIINGIESPDNSARALSTGDINGDGVDDLIIGAYNGDQPSNLDAGETYVVFGDQLSNADADDGSTDGVIELSGLDGSTGFVLKGTSTDDNSGRSVASGDINGDNIDDVIIGAYGAASLAGETYVVFGKTTAFSSSIDISDLSSSEGFTLNGVDAGDESGKAVAAGDVDGDGIDDVIIGARQGDPVGSNSGETYVVFGQTASFGGSVDLSGLDGSDGFVINGQSDGDNSGRTVASGDINGDGIDDVVIGANFGDPNGGDAGETYVVFGKSTAFGSALELSNLSGSDGFVINGIDGGDESGYSVASGDINGDGIDDVITGALLADPNGSASGETYVVFGKTTAFASAIELSGLDGTDGFVLNGVGGGNLSGRAASVGDINGDGIDDAIVGAPSANSSSGETYVFFNARAQSISGNAGFRTMSAPVNGTVFDELLDRFWTQGFTNADAGASFDDNVWVWDESLDTDGDWVSLSDQNTDNLAAGQGFLFYIFSDDDATGPDEGFPKQISGVQFGGSGTFNSGSVNPISTLGDGRFFLAGNPYDKTVDWDLMTTSGLTATAYVYDHAIAGWRSWNGTIGNLTDGLIAPFQGFIIEGSGGSGSLTIEEADTVTTDGTFYKQGRLEPLVLELELESGERYNNAWLQFDERALAGRDRYDGLELQPLTGDYLQLFTAIDNETGLNINALPMEFEGTVAIPLKMLRMEDGVSTDATATLSWSGLEQFPFGWDFMLVDTETGEEINLTLAGEHPVSIAATGNKQKTNEEEQRIPLPAVQSADGDARYVLKVTAGEAGGPSELPTAVALKQNYPNPFNPATVIRFELPETQNVTLEVFDLSGRRIATLLDGPRSAGRHQIQWAPDNLASGLYLYKLRTGNRVVTKKMMLIK